MVFEIFTSELCVIVSGGQELAGVFASFYQPSRTIPCIECRILGHNNLMCTLKWSNFCHFAR